MNSTETKTYQIVIVDDHPIVRHGLKQIINQERSLNVCAEAESAQQAIEAIKKHNPDVALIDVSIKGTNGLELVKMINQSCPLPVLMISVHDESLYAERALRAGAKGYIMKEEATEKLLTAIKRVLRGEIYISDNMSERLLKKYIDGNYESHQSSVSTLTDRELEVFRLIGEGHSTRNIAENLNLSIKTIESHRAHIKDKLKLKNAVELMHHAVQWVQEESATV